MNFPLPSATTFMQLARQMEIAGLKNVLQTGRLINSISQLIDALQLERGTSNIWLSSGGRLFADERLTRVRQADQALEEAGRMLATLTQGAPQAGDARLFSRTARTLHALEELPALRRLIAEHAIEPLQAMARFSYMIRQLLTLIFEAADAATEPAVSRVLIALFSFMQGKELSGQERALGAAGFASGAFSEPVRQQLTALIDGQNRCFATFVQFAAEPVLTSWRKHQFENAEFERLRRIACTRERPEQSGEEMSLRWFALHTRRIDGLKRVQAALEQTLMACCRDAIQQAEQRDDEPPTPAYPEDQDESGGFQILISPLDGPSGLGDQNGPLPALTTGALTPQLSRSVLSLVQQQSLRLKQLAQELEALRASLDERKVIEQAKALLMRHRDFSEERAYQTLRTMAMNQNKRLVEIAAAMLAIADVL